ncbi:MAG: ATP-dependent DNA helicase RecG [Acutalibacteraceae bacterium]
MPSLFEMKIEALKGVGEKRGALLRRLGVNTVGELLRYYPRAYEDHTSPVDISSVSGGASVCIKATVESPVVERRAPGGKLISRVRVYDDTGAIPLTFFNNRFIKNMLKQGQTYIFCGKVSEATGRRELLSPEFSPAENGQRIKPVYSTTNGLTSRQIEQYVLSALQLLPQTVKEPIPGYIIEEYDLCTLEYSIQNIHRPTDEDALREAKRRLIFEELLILSLGLNRLKNNKREEISIKFEKDFTDEYFSFLPFKPTNAQKKAVGECVRDMLYSPSPMNRLVQGDVGSGKTAVAAALCYTAAKNGFQSAFMAPTEILAEQHYSTLSKTLEKSGVTVALLTGSQTAAVKNRIKKSLADGEIDIIIGTHALLTESVVFKRLALVVTDEQHRFGVNQRARLLSKGENPHLLVMSATPIPRTLALIIYGDLDISIINELPPGRQKTDTLLIDSSKRSRMYGFIKKYLDMGRQCYIVCPAVEENEFNLESAQEYADRIKKNEFKSYKVGLLHGKMKARDKDAVMKAFVSGELDLLVATTVIEVGVDVPNAVIMAVENAERFGLSQLHQLRGRVGRGSEKSYCILISDSKSEETLLRLKTMCQTSNGFEIAEADLKQRGPGDFFGARQHGLPELKIADLANMEYLQAAQKAAQEILANSPDLTDDGYRGLNAEIRRLFGRVGHNGLN